MRRQRTATQRSGDATFAARGAAGARPASAVWLPAIVGALLLIAPGRGAAADVSFSGSRIYFDATARQNEDQGTGKKSADSGLGVDVKRLYVALSYGLDDTWSMSFTSDIGDQGTKRYDVFVKKAYLQGHFSDRLNVRLGAADEAWIPYVEESYGYRYVEQTITDHLGFGTSADWGVHVFGRAGIVDYQVEAVNGRGYSNPSRSRSVDFEGRIGVQPLPGMRIAVGGYSGSLGNDTDAVPALHTARRFDALVAYSNPHLRVGGEYFRARNFRNVATAATDEASGWSSWASVPLGSAFDVFARYDRADPSKELDHRLRFTYVHAGVQHTFNAHLVGALVWKQAQVDGGSLSTGNGTIGSTVSGARGKYDEIGAFAQFRI